MELEIIQNDLQYNAYLDWVDEVFDCGVSPESAEGKKVAVALLLIKQYEGINNPIPYPYPIEVIKIKMEEREIRNKDLVGKIGSKGYVSAILNKRKPLTLELAKYFHTEFDILAGVFLI